MAKKLHVKTGDTVQVISGKDIGKTGKVIAVNKEKHRVRIEGVKKTLPGFMHHTQRSEAVCRV